MRKKWNGRLYAAMIGTLLGLLGLYPQEAIIAARSSCHAWASQVMPALFPYMVLSRLFLSAMSGKLLLVPLAMLGGSPVGANLVQAAQYPPQKTQRLAALCTTVSPLFILGALSGGWQMLLSHWLGAGIAWACVRLPQGRLNNKKNDTGTHPPPQTHLAEVMRGAALAMIYICGYMVLFGVVSSLVTHAFSLPTWAHAFLSSVLEMAGGCIQIQALGLPSHQTAPLLCAAVSFGGLSIFMQNAAFLRPSGVPMGKQLWVKIIHGAAAYGICRLLYLSWSI